MPDGIFRFCNRALLESCSTRLSQADQLLNHLVPFGKPLSCAWDKGAEKKKDIHFSCRVDIKQIQE